MKTINPKIGPIVQELTKDYSNEQIRQKIASIDQHHSLENPLIYGYALLSRSGQIPQSYQEVSSPSDLALVFEKIPPMRTYIFSLIDSDPEITKEQLIYLQNQPSFSAFVNMITSIILQKFAHNQTERFRDESKTLPKL